MFLPQFLIADNDQFPENSYVVHTGSPCFIMDADNAEYQILDGSSPTPEQMDELIEQAMDFYESELEGYDDEYESYS